MKDAQSFSKGSKRLFSHTLTRFSQEEDSASNYGSGSDGRHLDEDDPFEKRHRTSDWPLGGNGKAIGGGTASEADGPGSPMSNYSDDAAQPRSSRFIEGSMRNRASQKPPRKYVATETELSCAEENENTKYGKPQRNKLTRNANHSVYAVAGEAKTETGRQSTIFRFGKSLAASFNPSNWKIWSKSQDSQAPDDKANDEAQAKLEKAYRDVKNIAPTPGRRFGPAGGSGIWNNAPSYDSPANPNEINASEIDASQKPPSQKRYGRVFGTPSSMEGLGDEYDSAQQNQSKLSTPADLYSVPSHQLLHSNESKSSFTYGAITGPYLKHVPSRKDLRVQQKLVKRVSNLESKLEAARLELVKSLGIAGMPPGNGSQPPPARGGKSRFIPGALSSLPSERLLSGYTQQNEYASEESLPAYIGAALTTDDKVSLASTQNLVGETPGRPSISSFTSSVREHSNKESYGTAAAAAAAAAAVACSQEADQGTPSKKRKSMTKTSTAANDDDDEPSQLPKDNQNGTSNPPTNPAKKARNTREKPSPELLLPSSSSGSPENVDPEKKAVMVQLGGKQQGNPKLIVKKRVPLEAAVGSRIPRKGSRKGTPPSFGDCNENAAGEDETVVAVQPTGKLKKAGRVRVKSVDISRVDKETKAKENLPEGNTKKITTSTSMESFEWGPDVF